MGLQAQTLASTGAETQPNRSPRALGDFPVGLPLGAVAKWRCGFLGRGALTPFSNATSPSPRQSQYPTIYTHSRGCISDSPPPKVRASSSEAIPPCAPALKPRAAPAAWLKVCKPRHGVCSAVQRLPLVAASETSAPEGPSATNTAEDAVSPDGEPSGISMYCTCREQPLL